MKLTFIGTDGSMGLRKGKTYRVEIKTYKNSSLIYVDWDGGRCPYSSPAAFAKNWKEAVPKCLKQ